jgi:hypothetical protein
MPRSRRLWPELRLRASATFSAIPFEEAKNRKVTTSLPNMHVMSMRLPTILSTLFKVTDSGWLAKAALRVSNGPAPPSGGQPGRFNNCRTHYSCTLDGTTLGPRVAPSPRCDGCQQDKLLLRVRIPGGDLSSVRLIRESPNHETIQLKLSIDAISIVPKIRIEPSTIAIIQRMRTWLLRCLVRSYTRGIVHSVTF